MYGISCSLLVVILLVPIAAAFVAYLRSGAFFSAFAVGLVTIVAELILLVLFFRFLK